MNTRRALCALLGLLTGLLFYLAYRSDHTVSNRLLAYFCGPVAYSQLKLEARHCLPVPAALRGSLPSALWCFIVTSLLGGWRIRVFGKLSLPLARLSPLANAGWEVVQWLHWTDGRADWQDALAGVIGWLMAEAMFLRTPNSPEITTLRDWRAAVVVAGFACMGFADVWK